VTAIPGTTRDVLRERIHIGGMPLATVDTAGLRSAADVIEAEGVRRAHAEMRAAQITSCSWSIGAADPARSRSRRDAHAPLQVR